MSNHSLHARAAGVLVCCAGLALGAAAATAGSTFTWGSAASGDWTLATNWNPNSGPPNGAADSAVINATGSPYTVTMNLSPALLDLTLDSIDATLAMGSGRILSIGGLAWIRNGTLTMNSSTVTGAGTLRNDASIVAESSPTIGAMFEQNGTLTIRGRTGVNTTLTITPSFTNNGLIDIASIQAATSSNLRVDGTLSNAAGGELRVGVGSGGARSLRMFAMENFGTVQIDRTVTLGDASGLGGAYTNMGVWNLAAGTITTMAGAGLSFTQSGGNLDAQGAFELSNGDFNFDGGTVTGGGVRLTNATLNIGAGSTGAGSVVMRGTSSNLSGDLAAAQTLTVRGETGLNTTVTAAAPFSNAGLIELTTLGAPTSAALHADGGLTNTGEVRSSVGSGGARTLRALTMVNNGLVTVDWSLDLAPFGGVGSFTNNGQWNIAAGQTQSMSGSSESFTQAAGNLDVLGAFEVSNGDFNFDGGTVTGGAPRLTNGTLNIGAGSTGAGSFVMRGTSSDLSGDLAAAQTLTVRGETGLNTTVTAAAPFSNAGLIELTTLGAPTSAALHADGGLTNTGEVRIGEGAGGARTLRALTMVNDGLVSVDWSLDLTPFGGAGAFTNNAQWNIAAGRTLSMSSASESFTHAAGNLNVLGAFEVSNGVFNFDGGTVTGGAPRLTNGTLNIGAGSAGEASFVMRGTSSDLSGDIAAAQTLTIRGETGLNTTVTAGGAVANAGLIELTTTGAPTSAALQADGGLTNTGEFRVAQGAGGARTLRALTMVNDGLVQVDWSVLLTPSGGAGAFTNNAQWNIAAGQTQSMDFTSESFTQAGGNLDVLGAFEVSNGVFNFNGGTVTGGAPRLTNGTLHIGAGSAGEASFVMRNTAGFFSGDIAAAQTLTIRGEPGFNSTTTVLGSTTNSGLIELTTIGSATNAALNGAGTLVNLGEIRISQGAGGARTLGIELDNRADLILERNVAVGRAGANSVNSSDIDLMGTTMTLIGDSFTNQAGGLIHGSGGFGTTGLGAFVNEGTISPGDSIGVIAFTGGFTQAAGGLLDIEISGTGVGGSDRLTITGAAALDGGVDVTLLGGYVPDWGDRWSILTYQSFTGDMMVSAPSLSDPDLLWWSEATGDSFDIGVRHIADVNHDDIVDFGDLNLVLSFYNTAGEGLAGDANEDGVVDFTDLNIVISFFNTQAPPNVVPAPGAVALLLAGLAAPMRRRRR